eukprot:5729641-Pyramimonas_sp.AAC.2
MIECVGPGNARAPVARPASAHASSVASSSATGIRGRKTTPSVNMSSDRGLRPASAGTDSSRGDLYIV